MGVCGLQTAALQSVDNTYAAHDPPPFSTLSVTIPSFYLSLSFSLPFFHKLTNLFILLLAHPITSVFLQTIFGFYLSVTTVFS